MMTDERRDQSSRVHVHVRVEERPDVITPESLPCFHKGDPKLRPRFRQGQRDQPARKPAADDREVERSRGHPLAVATSPKRAIVGRQPGTLIRKTAGG